MGFNWIEKVYAIDYNLSPGGSPGFLTGKVLYNSTNEPNSTLMIVGVRIFNIIVLVAGVLAVLYLIWSGIQYIISAGNAERIKSARSGIINAIIGIVIIVAAYAIVRFAISIANTINNAI